MTVLEDYSEQCLEMMCKLMQHMDKATIITSDQMNAVRLFDVGIHMTLFLFS